MKKVLAIRTDQPVAELYLLNVDLTATAQQVDVVAEFSWQADRQLANTLLATIEQLLAKNSIGATELYAVAVYTGSGSFTGLRIGTSVANALAYSLGIRVIALVGKDWLERVPDGLQRARVGTYAIVQYDREANIT